MKSRCFAICAGALLTLTAGAQTIPLYSNYTLVSFPPQIDARAFDNRGTFSLSTELPFDTQNTLFFTNRGAMYGSVGYRFDYVSPTGRKPTDTFVNSSVISVSDNSYAFFGSQGFAVGGAAGSYLLINATNVINSQLLDVGAGGILKIDGVNVNLNRSGLRTGLEAFSGIIIGGGVGIGYGTASNYVNPPGVLDLYWAIGTNQVLSGRDSPLTLTPTTKWNLPVSSPVHQVIPRDSAAGAQYSVSLPRFGFGIPSTQSSIVGVWTNSTSATNRQYQIVYSYLPRDTNVTTEIRFTTNGGPAVAMVKFGMGSYDVALARNVTNEVYFIDSTGATDPTNYFLGANQADSTARPSTYSITTAAPFNWSQARGSNTFYSPQFIYNNAYSNSIVTNIYLAYSASVGSALASADLNPIYGGGGISIIDSPFYYYGYSNPALYDPTNSVGRIEINADNLTMTNARVRAESLLTIRTKNLVANDGFTGDSKLWVLDITSPKPTLVISNLVPPTVRRLEGSIAAWTAVWTNFTTVRTPQGTNDIQIAYAMTIVDNNLTAVQTTSILDLTVSATNSVFYDDLRPIRGLRVDSQSLTINGEFSLGGGLPNWNSTEFPNLMNLTNNGSISFLELGYFGSDRPQPYQNLVNRGLIYGDSFDIRANRFENTLGGQLYAGFGPMFLTASNAVLDYGWLWAPDSDIEIAATNVSLIGANVRSGSTNSNPVLDQPGRLVFDVSGSLNAPAGAGFGASLQATDGFELRRLPATSDLSGAALYWHGIQFRESSTVWAGRNRGKEGGLGYTNNAAPAVLALDGDPFTLFRLIGTGTNNAIYAENLQLQRYATNVNDAFLFETNIVVYFANSTGVKPETLDGQAGGRFIWTRDYAGPNSSSQITIFNGISNQVVRVNSAKLASSVLDSDADGIKNNVDPSPFDPVKGIKVQRNAGPPATVTISWNAAASTLYQIQYKSDLNATQWSLAQEVNSAATNGVQTVTFPVTPGQNRFYRINYTP